MLRILLAKVVIGLLIFLQVFLLIIAPLAYYAGIYDRIVGIDSALPMATINAQMLVVGGEAKATPGRVYFFYDDIEKLPATEKLEAWKNRKAAVVDLAMATDKDMADKDKNNMFVRLRQKAFRKNLDNEITMTDLGVQIAEAYVLIDSIDKKVAESGANDAVAEQNNGVSSSISGASIQESLEIMRKEEEARLRARGIHVFKDDQQNGVSTSGKVY